MRIDPTAALKCWPVDIDLAGRTYRIPAHPAAAWMLAVLQGDWTDIVPGMLDGTADELDDALLNGTLTHDDLVTAAKDTLAAAAGTRWWTAVRLIHGAADESIGGELTLSGIDIQTVPLAAVLQAVYRICTRHATAAQRAKLDMELDHAPQGVSAAERYDETEAADAFEAFAASRVAG